MKRTVKPRVRRTPCAICDNTNQTTQLCDACRADPANAGWSEAWPEVELTDDLDGATVSPKSRGGWQRGTPRTLGDVYAGPTIEERILALLLDEAGTGSRRRLTHAEIAANVGCSRSAVSTILGALADSRRAKHGHAARGT